MTVSTSTNNVVYRGNGAATEFAVPFKVLDEGHLVVTRRDFDTGALLYTYTGTDFIYDGIGDDAGTLTLAGTALDDDFELVIERTVPYTQDLDIVNAGGFYPETVEEQLDLMTMGIQQIGDLAARGAVVPVGETGQVLPKALDRAGKFWAFDADGAFVASSGTGNDAALRTDLAALNGAALITITPSGTGANSRNLQTRLLETVSLLDYGDATVDAGDSLQRAHDAANAAGVIIEVPPSSDTAHGYFPVLTTPTLTKPVYLKGGSWRTCELGSNVAGIIMIKTTNWFHVEGVEFTLFGAAQNTGVAWKQLAASDGHGGSGATKCRFSGGLYGIWLERANTVRISGCILDNYYTYGLWAQNGTNSDEGDSFVSDTIFAGGSRVQASAAKLTNSGWYWNNFKINGINTYGIDIDTGTNGPIGDFGLVNGSIEGYGTAGIRLRGFLLSQTGSTHSNTTIDNLASVGGVQVGQVVTGAGIPAGTTVASVGITSITISQAATATANGVTIEISASVTKTNISNVQLSSDATYGIDIDVNVTDTTVNGGSINGGTAASGTAINIRQGATGISIGGGINIYQILSGIIATTADVGLTLGDIRFGDDVTNIYSGESGTVPNNKGSVKRLMVSRYIHNPSDVDWIDCYKWQGTGMAHVMVSGTVQNVGSTNRSFHRSFLNTTLGTLREDETLGAAVDAQIVTVGSDSVLQVKRATGIGTAVDAAVTVILQHYPTAVVRVPA